MAIQTEIEVKFLDVDHDTIRAKLKSLGAVCRYPMRLMRRALFDYTDNRFQKSNQTQRLRIRDEGDKVTITFKYPSDTQYDNEVETTIGSYETMQDLLIAIGLKTYSFQESKRETWELDNVEIVLDEWPWLNPYIEIEGSTESAIRKVSEQLGFDWHDAAYGSVDTAYRHQYPKMTQTESISDVGEVRFNIEIPQYLADRK